MELERGKAYTIDPRPTMCLNCGHEMTEIIRGSVLVYLGKLDGQDMFIYDNPPACPNCYHFLRHHIEILVINVTDEFHELLEK